MKRLNKKYNFDINTDLVKLPQNGPFFWTLFMKKSNDFMKSYEKR